MWAQSNPLFEGPSKPAVAYVQAGGQFLQIQLIGLQITECSYGGFHNACFVVVALVFRTHGGDEQSQDRHGVTGKYLLQRRQVGSSRLL